MAIRYDVHRKLKDTQANQVKTFNGLFTFSTRQQAFVPRSGKTKEANEMKWGALIRTAADDHQKKVADTYAQFKEDHFVAKETVDAIATNGGHMVSDGIAIIDGAKPAHHDGAEALGYHSGIGMTPDRWTPNTLPTISTNWEVRSRPRHRNTATSLTNTT